MAAEAMDLLRKAGTDNEKIAALLLVSRAFQTYGELSQEERKQVFDAVGFSFVNRLLGTDEPGAGVSDYQQLGVALLACFATDPQLATHSEVTSKVPLLLKLISSRSPSEALCKDCLQLLLSLTGSPRGVHLLVASSCLQTVARELVGREGGGGVRECLGQLLEGLLGQEAVVGRYGEVVEETLGLLASGFRERQDEVKFELCSVLCSVLESVGQVMVVRGDEQWVGDVAAGLKDILSSKITSEMRGSALCLAAQLCQLCGVQWSLALGHSKLFRLLANLASVEMSLNMEDGKGLESLESQLICSCCVILETSVAFTASQISSSDVLTEEDMLQLHSAFSEAFTSTTHFLNSLSPPLPPHNPLLIAIVRVLGAWLAEETLTLSSELYQLLPRLLEMCQSHLKQGQGERGEEVERDLNNPLRFLLPGLSHLMAEEGAREAVKTVLPQLLVQFMKTLYGGCMSAEAVSLFALSLEVLLTVCVSEVGVRRDSVFCQLARLLSSLLLSDVTSLRLQIEAVLLWLMIAREQGIM